MLFGAALGILFAGLGFTAYLLSAKRISPALSLLIVGPIFIALGIWLAPIAAPHLFTWRRLSD